MRILVTGGAGLGIVATPAKGRASEALPVIGGARRVDSERRAADSGRVEPTATGAGR